MMSALVVLVGCSLGQITVEPENVNMTLHEKVIKVTGIYDSTLSDGSRKLVKLKKCDAWFNVSDVKFDKPDTYQNMTLTGPALIETDPRSKQKRLIVAVKSLQVFEDDVSEFDRRARKLAESDFAAKQELVRWADQRVARYGWKNLADRANSLFLGSLDAERVSASGNPSKLNDLKKRVAQAGNRVADYDFVALDHEILKAEYQTVDKKSKQALQQFARKVADQLLPPNPAKVAPLDTELQTRYHDAPIVEFVAAKGDASLRHRFARYWLCELLHEINQLDYIAQPNNPNNLFDLAERAMQQQSEYPNYRAHWVKLALSLVREKIRQTNKIEIEQAAEHLARLQEPQLTIADLYLDWLAGQRDNLERAEVKQMEKGGSSSARDLQGRLELANLANRWMPDDKRARELTRKLLNECVAADPNFTEAEKQLVLLGYKKNAAGEYVDPKQISPEAIPLANESVSGIGIGDSAKKVISILGQPSSRTRVAGKDWVRQYWEYEGTLYIMGHSDRDGSLYVLQVRKLK